MEHDGSFSLGMHDCSARQFFGLQQRKESPLRGRKVLVVLRSHVKLIAWQVAALISCD